MFSPLCSGTPFFFTIGALFDFGVLFCLLDAFLKFFLIEFLEKLLSGNEQEVIEIVDYLSELGIIHDLVALGEQGFETFEENIANGGRGNRGFHWYVRVKVSVTQDILPKCLPIFYTPASERRLLRRCAP